jgi:hypothetical protein
MGSALLLCQTTDFHTLTAIHKGEMMKEDEVLYETENSYGGFMREAPRRAMVDSLRLFYPENSTVLHHVSRLQP